MEELPLLLFVLFDMMMIHLIKEPAAGIDGLPYAGGIITQQEVCYAHLFR